MHVPRPGIFQVQVLDLNNPKSLIHIGNFRDAQVAAVAASMGSTPNYNVRGGVVRREIERLALLDSGKRGSIWEKIDQDVPLDHNSTSSSELHEFLTNEYARAKSGRIKLLRDRKGGEARILSIAGVKFAYRPR